METRAMTLVRWGDKLVPRSLVEDFPHVPGNCPLCGGLGLVVETIDRERMDEMAPCWRCTFYCKTCKRRVKTDGHECK